MRKLLPEPFWPTLAALLLLSLLVAIVPYALLAFAWPNLTPWIAVPCYLAAVPVVWLLAARWDARDHPRNTNAPGH